LRVKAMAKYKFIVDVREKGAVGAYQPSDPIEFDAPIILRDAINQAMEIAWSRRNGGDVGMPREIYENGRLIPYSEIVDRCDDSDQDRRHYED
jgi:hypothetical protein